MRSRLLFAALVALVATAGCKKQPPPVEPVVDTTPVRPPPTSPLADKVESIRGEKSKLGRVQFEFDSTSVTSGTKTVIKENASILQANPEARVEIQGHADERGTTEYNLALGERRAQEVKSQMSRLGVSDSRMTVISYGEERPIDSRSNEGAWASNRRAEFRITGGAEPVEGTVP